MIRVRGIRTGVLLVYNCHNKQFENVSEITEAFLLDP